MKVLTFLFILFPFISSAQRLSGTYEFSDGSTGDSFEFVSNSKFTYSSFYDLGPSTYQLKGTFVVSNDTVKLNWFDRQLSSALKSAYFRIQCSQEDTVSLHKDSVQIIVRNFLSVELKNIQLEHGLQIGRHPIVIDLKPGEVREFVLAKSQVKNESHACILNVNGMNVICDCIGQNSLLIAIMNDAESSSLHLPDFLVLSKSHLTASSGKRYARVKK